MTSQTDTTEAGRLCEQVRHRARRAVDRTVRPLHPPPKPKRGCLRTECDVRSRPDRPDARRYPDDRTAIPAGSDPDLGPRPVQPHDSPEQLTGRRSAGTDAVSSGSEHWTIRTTCRRMSTSTPRRNRSGLRDPKPRCDARALHAGRSLAQGIAGASCRRADAEVRAVTTAPPANEKGPAHSARGPRSVWNREPGLSPGRSLRPRRRNLRPPSRCLRPLQGARSR